MEGSELGSDFAERLAYSTRRGLGEVVARTSPWILHARGDARAGGFDRLAGGGGPRRRSTHSLGGAGARFSECGAIGPTRTGCLGSPPGHGRQHGPVGRWLLHQPECIGGAPQRVRGLLSPQSRRTHCGTLHAGVGRDGGHGRGLPGGCSNRRRCPGRCRKRRAQGCGTGGCGGGHPRTTPGSQDLTFLPGVRCARPIAA